MDLKISVGNLQGTAPRKPLGGQRSHTWLFSNTPASNRCNGHALLRFSQEETVPVLFGELAVLGFFLWLEACSYRPASLQEREYNTTIKQWKSPRNRERLVNNGQGNHERKNKEL